MLAQSKHNGMALDAPEATDYIRASVAPVATLSMLKVTSNLYHMLVLTMQQILCK